MTIRVVKSGIFMKNYISRQRLSSPFISQIVSLPERKQICIGNQFGWFQSRLMTSSKRVQDRSMNKRVHDLEIVTEKRKTVSKLLFLMEVLKQEPDMISPVRSLNQYRKQLNLPHPHKISDFLGKSPNLFELYKDQRRVLWCGLTKEAEELLEEEQRLIEKNSDKAAEYVTKCLMMSMDKRLPLDKIAHFRRDFGLPHDFRKEWVHRYPQHFRVVKSGDGLDYLELVSWVPAWAITELEKKVLGVTEMNDHTPGMVSLAFPLKFPQTYKKVYVYREKIENFQKRSFLSPYADAQGLEAGSQEFDKRAVAVMHELLSFTIEKCLVTDHLTHFRRELVMPQKLMRILLKHFGIFYVSERGKRFSVLLTEAYEGSELIEKCPLVLWKDKVVSLTGYRKKKKNPIYNDLSDMDDKSLYECGSENELQIEEEETVHALDDGSLTCSDEMDMEEIQSAYKYTDIN